jgi:quinol-cytochrome oxidoreductase complex cytochrome b subunit
MALDINIKEKKPLKENKLDINKVFPEYINKWIFRGVILVMILFTYFVFVSNGGTLVFNYVDCPITAPTSCYNSAYQPLASPDSCLSLENIPIGESCGKKPNFWAVYYNLICMLFVVFGFLFNHLFYFLRSGNLRIPFDKEQGKKHPLIKIFWRTKN